MNLGLTGAAEGVTLSDVYSEPSAVQLTGSSDLTLSHPALPSTATAETALGPATPGTPAVGRRTRDDGLVAQLIHRVIVGGVGSVSNELLSFRWCNFKCWGIVILCKKCIYH